MERINEIKKKVKNHNDYKHIGYYDERDLPEIFEDIEYLLSLIDRYKTALENINEYKAGNESFHVQTLKEVARQSLEEKE